MSAFGNQGFRSPNAPRLPRTAFSATAQTAGSFSPPMRPAATSTQQPQAAAPPRASIDLSAYDPGRAQPIQEPSLGTPYNPPAAGGRPASSHPDFERSGPGFQVITNWHNPKTGDWATMPSGEYQPRPGFGWVSERMGVGQSPPNMTAATPPPTVFGGGGPQVAAPSPADQSGYDAWFASLRSNSAMGSNPLLAPKLERQAREQWGRWTPDQRAFAVSEADRRGANAARANTTNLPYADYTDPSTGEKFLADASGRLTRERDLINHYSSNSRSIGSQPIARMAAQYHDAGAAIPSWLQAIANNANANSPNAWYDLRYLDRDMWNSADEATRHRIRGGI